MKYHGNKNSVVTIEARPEPLKIDLARTAILVIDMQNDFCSPGGGFDRAGISIEAVAAQSRSSRPC